MKYYSTRYAHNILTGDFDESPQLYSESVKPEGRSPQHKGTHRNARTHALTHSRTQCSNRVRASLLIIHASVYGSFH